MGRRSHKPAMCWLCLHPILSGGADDELERDAIALGGDGLCDGCWCEWTTLRERRAVGIESEAKVEGERG